MAWTREPSQEVDCVSMLCMGNLAPPSQTTETDSDMALKELQDALDNWSTCPTTLRTYYVKCCRVWPVSITSRVGRCGLCGKIPRVTEATTEQKDETKRPTF